VFRTDYPASLARLEIFWALPLLLKNSPMLRGYISIVHEPE
jgi:hypothetical protein